MDTRHFDRQARGELRRAKKLNGGTVPDLVLSTIERDLGQRLADKERRQERRANAKDYFTNSSRLARLAPASAVAAALATGEIVHAAHATPCAGFITAPIAGGIVWIAARGQINTTGRRIYAATAISYASLWSAAVGAWGVAWHGSGDAALAAGAAILAAPWAYSNLWRWQSAPATAEESGEPLSWFREAWETYRPAEADMVDEVETSNGRQAKLVAPRGRRSAEDITSRAALIRSTYDPYTTILEPVSARTVVLTVLEREVTLAAGPRWSGPTLDPSTGLIRIGQYLSDGEDTHGQLWVQRSGATDFFIIGTKGSGKSGFLNRLACDIHLTPFAVGWFSDPQEGQCLPDWIDTADRYAIGGHDSIDENMALLRALLRITFRRSRYFGRQIKWVDEKGRERTGGKRYFDPTETNVDGVRIPLLHAFFDEMHVLVRHPEHGPEALHILGLIERLNRKAGVAISWAGHSAAQAEMGGSESAIIRNLIKEGARIAFRTGEALTSYQLGLSEDPSQLPEFFADGSKTHGLGLIGGGPDRRTTQFRAEWVDDVYEIARRPPAGTLDAMSAEAAAAPDDPELAPKTFVVPGFGQGHGTATPLIPTAQEKQTWADRLLPLFADGEEHSLGQIISAFPPEASDRSIRWGLKKLVTDGLLHTAGDKKPYRITDAGRARLVAGSKTEAVA